MLFDDDCINQVANDIDPSIWALVPWLIVAAVLLGVWLAR